MRLDFNVLWVEDSQDLVVEQKEKLERLIRKEGFRLRVKFASSVKEATDSVSDDIYGDHVDLVLMDYNLEGGPNGDQGLIAVRDLLPYKDIIFYSAQANNLRDIWAKTNVQGIYLSNREELPDTAEGLFHTLVKKVLDIDHSRGLVMGATSDIDHFINDCLEMLFSTGDVEMQAEAISLVGVRMKEIRDRFEAAAVKVEAIKLLSELADHHAVYTSADRLNLLRKMLKARKLDEKIRDPLKRYASEVLPKRNDLAHVRVQIDGFSRKLLNRKGEELTSDEMRALRLSLLENQELFEELHLSLKGG
jgi:CheY-like chemotaxis protein